MNPKRAASIALLVFVVASVVWLVVKESGGGGNSGPEGAASRPSAAAVIAYYFHGSKRCDTCRKIEAYAQAAIRQGFADQLARGRLEWRVVNKEEPANEHFVTDFELTANAIVLERRAGAGSPEWRNLDRIWELVGDKVEYDLYILEEVQAMLEEAGR